MLVAQASGELSRRAKEGLRTVALNPSSEFDVQAGWQLHRVLRSISPDVVHLHDPMGVALMAMALKMQPRLTPRPLIVASRRVDFHLKQNAFSRWKYRHVDVFIAVSRMIAGMLVEDGIPADRVDVVHDGVNISAIDRVPAEDVHKAFWLPHGSPIVGNVAALVAKTPCLPEDYPRASLIWPVRRHGSNGVPAVVDRSVDAQRVRRGKRREELGAEDPLFADGGQKALATRALG